MTQLVVGMLGIYGSARKATGRCIVRVVQNRRRETLERIIRSCIQETTEVWVGDWVGYVWMDGPDLG